MGSPERAEPGFATATVGFPLTYDHQAAAATLRTGKGGRRAGAEEVSTVRQLTEMFRIADERLGGGHGLSTASAYLADAVVPMPALQHRPRRLLRQVRQLQ
ncbi:hypothetical protein [Kitasatospora sp. NPDC050463]|uniref:hypothetical protein n=1 Tax=Kitasatospora sp. NPDC050463 TaxID=3155786 RepID=UPI0033FF23EC